MKKRIFTIAAASLTVALGLGTLSGCASLESLTGLSLPSSSPSATASDAAATSKTPDDASGKHSKTGFLSPFSANGAVHIYTNIEGIDYVLAVYPSQTTPDPSAWYPKGDKLFSMNLQAYDLSTDLRAPYLNKRMVYLSTVSITSTLTTMSGATGSSSSFVRHGNAAQLTFDPEPLVNGNAGILLMSPKGIFDMRNQTIGDLPLDTIGITLHMQFSVHVQRTAGSPLYDDRTVGMDVPIGITPSTKATVSKSVPVDAF
ncbi:hypothetical protein [Bifidobacterium tibiigranuli]|jgi:hypothetical protein|uniref:hypothetical protein n=1 Tax=Bifidobacterium tibiigranuli TaxID=2172043 RepID=UPI0026EF51C9|nr:hypothetical protein [Bifidobacterium tibiigranuli]MCI1650505.1 hypothetical protein [Bifidobacterium tibiigranuli]MCI2185907.1 hypothetical protein [Bifidobacterium tibiigranuli]MCI2204678.1 hypothetical protein [Bifidobacterium tibiigranuli]